jgi:hypothetical protein
VCTLFSSRPDILVDAMARRRRDQSELPFGAVPVDGADDPSSTEAPRVPRGRPRKWATEADRKRAYRERLAADLSEPARLRRDLRSERGRSAAFARASEQRRRELDQTKQLLARALDAQDELEATIEQLRDTGEHWRSRAVQITVELNNQRRRRDRA